MDNIDILYCPQSVNVYYVHLSDIKVKVKIQSMKKDYKEP